MTTCSLLRFLFCFFIGHSALHAQHPDSVWTKVIGGSQEEGSGLSGPKFFGSARTAVDVALDSSIYVGTYGSSSDGFFTKSPSTSEDAFLFRLSAKGDTLWSQALSGTGSDRFLDLVALKDTSCLVVGTSNSDDGDFNGVNTGGSNIGFVAHYTRDGQLLYRQSFPSTYHLSAAALKQNGTVWMGGNYDAPNSIEAFVMEFDPSTSYPNWQKVETGINANDDYNENIWSVAEDTSSGALYALGVSGDFSLVQTDNLFLIKYDSSGNFIWKKEYGSTMQDGAGSITVDPQGFIYCAGMVSAGDDDVDSVAGGPYDPWIVKLDSRGTIVWEGTYGGTNVDVFQGIEYSSKGHLLAYGYRRDTIQAPRYQFYMVEVDTSQGDTLHTWKWGGSENDILLDMAFMPGKKELVLCGRSASADGFLRTNFGNHDIVIMRTIYDSTQDTLSVKEWRQPVCEIYPNPAFGEVHFQSSQVLSRIALFNLQGQRLLNHAVPLTKQGQLPLSTQWPAGLYILRMHHTSGYTVSKHLVIKPIR